MDTRPLTLVAAARPDSRPRTHSLWMQNARSRKFCAFFLEDGRGDFHIQREYAFDQAACVRALRVVLDSAPKTSTPEPEEALATYPELAAAG